jgi:hypothetical protein
MTVPSTSARRRRDVVRQSASALALIAASGAPALAQDQYPTRDVLALFSAAEKDGRVGTARKIKLVDARPAVPGKVIVTRVKGVVETTSKPAQGGDWVVRNRCPETGNEEYLVTAARFADRYEDPSGEPDAEGWRPVRPKGEPRHYFIVTDDEGKFSFTAPWGEAMIAEPGDVTCRDLGPARLPLIGRLMLSPVEYLHRRVTLSVSPRIDKKEKMAKAGAWAKVAGLFPPCPAAASLASASTRRLFRFRRP